MDNSSRLEKCLKYGFVLIFYTAHIFELLNKLNLSLQGTQITLVDCKRKVSPSAEVAMVWKEELVEGNWQLFAFLQSIAENVPQQVVGIMTSHLQYLADEFNER